MNTLIIFGAKYLFVLVFLIAASVALSLSPKKRIPFLLSAIGCGVFAIVLAKVCGRLYFSPRPFTQGVIPLFSHEPDNGFPSDHTVLCAALAALTFSVSRKIGVGLFVLAGVVGASRVASGIHSPLDIVVGLLIGVISAVVSLGLVSLLYREKRVLQEGEKSTT